MHLCLGQKGQEEGLKKKVGENKLRFQRGMINV